MENKLFHYLQLYIPSTAYLALFIAGTFNGGFDLRYSFTLNEYTYLSRGDLLLTEGTAFLILNFAILIAVFIPIFMTKVENKVEYLLVTLVIVESVFSGLLLLYALTQALIFREILLNTVINKIEPGAIIANYTILAIWLSLCFFIARKHLFQSLSKLPNI